MTRARPILIVDGDPVMRAMLHEQLSRDDAFLVTTAATVPDALRHLADQAGGFGAVIASAGQDDGDGAGLCAAIRADGWTMPMILLTGAPGTDAGDGTAVMIRPFRIGDLLTRLRACLASPSAGQPAPHVRIGPFEFHPDEKALRDNQTNLRIRLTEKETAILAFLLRMGGKAASRLDLLREVWGYHPAVTTHTLETHVYRLRRKIEADPANARLLITEEGGYRLAAGALP